MDPQNFSPHRTPTLIAPLRRALIVEKPHPIVTMLFSVIPAYAGRQCLQLPFGTASSANNDDNILDPRLRGDDGNGNTGDGATFFELVANWIRRTSELPEEPLF